jgi:hypothetical protein
LVRVGGEDAVDVGVDLADVGAERARHRDGRGVRASSAERRDVAVHVGALEACEHRHRALVEPLADPARVQALDPGAVVRAIGEHAHLGSGERVGRVPETLDRHREQPDRLLLARGQQHVELAGRRTSTSDLLGELQEPTGLASHRGDDDGHGMAGPGGRDDPLGHGGDALRAPHAGAAEFLDDQAQGASSSGA